MGWRDLPVDNSMIGSVARAAEPTFRQVFIASCDTENGRLSGLDLDRHAYMLRKRTEHEIKLNRGTTPAGGVGTVGTGHDGAYFASLSSRTIVYKGMLTTTQLAEFFPDLTDPRMSSAMALVHSRFSTNTFPSWPLAHPYRFIAHNGEINTLRGNLNWMNARRRSMASELLGDDLDKIWPLIAEGQSDSACIDNALELLVAGGYSLSHAMMLLIPEAWSDNPLMDEGRRGVFENFAGGLGAPGGPPTPPPNHHRQ